MTLSLNDGVRLLQMIMSLQHRIEVLESIVHENRDFVVSTDYPAEPFEGQVVLRTDLPGGAGGGTMFRYDAAGGTWRQIV